MATPLMLAEAAVSDILKPVEKILSSYNTHPENEEQKFKRAFDCVKKEFSYDPILKDVNTTEACRNIKEKQKMETGFKKIERGVVAESGIEDKN
jgi:hypothetical protein